MGDSVASTRITSYSILLFSSAFRPGSENVPFRISVSYSSINIASHYPITCVCTIFPQIFQGCKQHIFYAQLWLPLTPPVLFCICFLSNLYHLIEGCSLCPGDPHEFCVGVFCYLFVFHIPILSHYFIFARGLLKNVDLENWTFKGGMDEYAIKYIVDHKISDITENVYTQREFNWLKKEIEKNKIECRYRATPYLDGCRVFRQPIFLIQRINTHNGK